MRLRNIKGASEIIRSSSKVAQEPLTLKGRWNKAFGNENAIRIEIGMGKGKFITTLAKENPHINYIGIERYASVLLRALQKIEGENIPNLLFLCMDAKELPLLFEKEEIEKIYLNFSDPWPKDRHAKRRLPSKEFLATYDLYLKLDGKIEFKTDNRGLFDFAVEQVQETNWNIDGITYDLHHDNEMNKGNVMTEYEEKFSSMGNPIHKVIISRA